MRLNDELRFGKDGFPLDSESRVESRSDSKKSEVSLQFDELFVDSNAVDVSLTLMYLTYVTINWSEGNYEKDTEKVWNGYLQKSKFRSDIIYVVSYVLVLLSRLSGQFVGILSLVLNWRYSELCWAHEIHHIL